MDHSLHLDLDHSLDRPDDGRNRNGHKVGHVPAAAVRGIRVVSIMGEDRLRAQVESPARVVEPLESRTPWSSLIRRLRRLAGGGGGQSGFA